MIFYLDIKIILIYLDIKTKEFAMKRHVDLVLTALAPAIWGSTYIITTEMLPQGMPLTVAMLRALPAGLILLALTRVFPPANWYGRVFILGALNFSIFWAMLFVAAYRLPGGLTATLGAIQPLIVLLLARVALGQNISFMGVSAALAGLVGVGLLVLGPEATADPLGLIAALAGAASMAAGTVLTRKWQPPVSSLTFTAWQLTAGGLLLLPLSIIYEPALPELTTNNIVGFVWLGLIGGALTYFLWFRGIAKLGPATVTAFGFLSPLTVVLLGWAVLGQVMTPIQGVGAAIVLASVWLGQRAGRTDPKIQIQTGVRV